MKHHLFVYLATAATLLIPLATHGRDWPDPTTTPIAEGPFSSDQASMKTYQVPDWFRDAKLGIWAHWGPQSVPRRGDWYARRMYEQLGSADPNNGKIRWSNECYVDHINRYGHPSEHGYKDLLPLWKAERWDPDALMALYKKAGARYFVSMGIHHDNFALWNSPSHRWNSVLIGPKRDIVGEWQAAAKKQGLPFGVSEHLAASYTWFQTAHGWDSAGAKIGVPYDGNLPDFQDLYHSKADPGDVGWLTKDPLWHAEWSARIRELIDTYHPDLLYSDSVLPFGEVGARLLAHYYNSNTTPDGRTKVVYACKQPSEGRWVHDLERGVMDEIKAEPWQTDTSIGDWFYKRGQRYRTSNSIVQQLADIVSKNGNLLINVVQTPEGNLEPDMVQILDELGSWMAVNGPSIYATRPWKVFGERPAAAKEIKSLHFNEDLQTYTSEDIRYTVSKDGRVLYAIVLGCPKDGVVHLKSLGSHSPYLIGKCGPVKMLGLKGNRTTTRDESGLHVNLLDAKPVGPIQVFALAVELPSQKTLKKIL